MILYDQIAAFMFLKSLVRSTSLILIASLLLGCVTNHGYGVVIAEQHEKHFVERKNYIKNQTKHDAKVGGTVGSAGGGVLLGSFAAWYGFMEVGVGSALAGAAVWGAAGALTFGLAGAAIGGTAGYVIEKSKSKYEHYQFKVRSLQDATKIYTVKQYSPPIPLNTKVKILERNGSTFVRKN